MRRPRARRGGRLWPAVLAASVVLLLVTGGRLLATPGLAADVPVVDRVDVPSPGPSAPAEAGPPSAGTAAETGTSREAAPAWRTRSAAPRGVARVVAPERLRAEAVGLDLRVEPRGVADDGQMALPEDPTVLGWYRFGAAPADARGAVVLAGHVDSARHGVGPLARAAGLHRGDVLEVTDARGRTTTYAVVRVQRIGKSDLDPDTVFDRSGPALLRLVTCAGVYDRDRGGYADNLVVTAERR